MNERLDVLGRVILALGLLVAPACDDSQDEPSKTADAAAADTGDSLQFRDKDGQIPDGSADAAVVDAHVELEPSDLDLISACEAEEPCTGSHAQMADARPYTISDGTACLLEHLQERRPGRYAHEATSVHPMGRFGANHVLIVRADGTALYARTQYTTDVRKGREGTMTPEPAKLCKLREPSYFEECVAAVRQLEPPTAPVPELPWKCAFGEGTDRAIPGELQWFESCEPAPATCE